MVYLSRRDILQSTAGFALTASLAAGAAIKAEAMPSSHSKRLIVDGLDTSDVNEDFLKLMDAGSADCAHISMVSLDDIVDLYGFAYEHHDKVIIAKSVGDIFQAREDGKKSIVMGAQAAYNLEAALYSQSREGGNFSIMAKTLRDLKGLGLGVQGICYNTTNVFGSGCIDPEGPLTRAGVRLVEEIHKNKIILDVGGHTGERTSLDAIKLSSGIPVVCTHANFAALNPNKRCISDRMAEAIAATGGVIGITAISAFHTHNASRSNMPDVQATLSQHLDHYDYAKRLFGIEHVGLGPDFVAVAGRKREHDPNDSAAFPADMMPTGLRTLVKDFENISKLPNLISGLKSRGWTESELDALLGGNWLRVYKQVWGA